VTILTAIMLLSGHIAGLFCALEARDRFSLAMVLVVRNVAIATAVAVTVLGRTEFAIFATAYFLNQVPLLLAALGLFRLLVPQGSASKRGDHEPARDPVR